MRRKKAGRKPGRRPGLAGMTIAQLEAAIAQRKAAVAGELQAKRNALVKQLAALDEEIAALGAAPRRGPGRPKKTAGAPVAPRTRGGMKVAKAPAAAKAGKRMRSSPAQIARTEKAVLAAVKGKSGGLLKIELSKTVPGRPQTLNTALKKLLESKKLKTKGVTRNTRYLAA
ncbi:MAG: hypothetical protein JW889_00205 [Verrucomicrobia bacterium]|nr:hypothetical protein [Verrucomicrobiota bacterium]